MREKLVIDNNDVNPLPNNKALIIEKGSKTRKSRILSAEDEDIPLTKFVGLSSSGRECKATTCETIKYCEKVIETFPINS